MILKYNPGKISDKENEKGIILERARLCSKKYGFVIHEYRLLAAAFSDEDFSKHDNCNPKFIEEVVKPRSFNKHLADLVISPNPTNSHFDIYSPNVKIHKILIFNLQGIVVHEKTIATNTYIFENIDLKPGVYIVSLFLDDETQNIQKIIIQ